MDSIIHKLHHPCLPRIHYDTNLPVQSSGIVSYPVLQQNLANKGLMANPVALFLSLPRRAAHPQLESDKSTTNHTTHPPQNIIMTILLLLSYWNSTSPKKG